MFREYNGKNTSQIQCFANISDWELVESIDAKFTNTVWTVAGCIYRRRKEKIESEQSWPRTKVLQYFHRVRRAQLLNHASM